MPISRSSARPRSSSVPRCASAPLAALAPGALLDVVRRQTLAAGERVARQPIDRRARLGLLAPQLCRGLACRRERGARRPAFRQICKTTLGFFCLRPHLSEIGGELGDGFGGGGEPSLGRQCAAGHLGLAGTSARQRRFGIAQLRARDPVAIGGGFAGGGCRRCVGSGGPSRRRRRFDLAGKSVEPVAVAQLLCRARRAGGEAGVAVPAPQSSVAVDEALTWGQKRLQVATVGVARDPAGTSEAAPKRRRRRHRGGE